jgi:hypothetical protein
VTKEIYEIKKTIQRNGTKIWKTSEILEIKTSFSQIKYTVKASQAD